MNTSPFSRNIFPSVFAGNPLGRDFERLMSELMVGRQTARAVTPRAGSTSPAVNIWESDHCYFLEAEIPGVKMEDLDISVLGKELTIRGDRKAEELPEKAAFHRRERGIGSFARVVQLPSEINAEAVEAMLKNGVLTLRLPKIEAAKPRKIAVAKA